MTAKPKAALDPASPLATLTPSIEPPRSDMPPAPAPTPPYQAIPLARWEAPFTLPHGTWFRRLTGAAAGNYLLTEMQPREWCLVGGHVGLPLFPPVHLAGSSGSIPRADFAPLCGGTVVPAEWEIILGTPY